MSRWNILAAAFSALIASSSFGADSGENILEWVKSVEGRVRSLQVMHKICLIPQPTDPAAKTKPYQNLEPYQASGFFDFDLFLLDDIARFNPGGKVMPNGNIDAVAGSMFSTYNCDLVFAEGRPEDLVYRVYTKSAKGLEQKVLKIRNGAPQERVSEISRLIPAYAGYEGFVIDVQNNDRILAGIYNANETTPDAIIIDESDDKRQIVKKSGVVLLKLVAVRGNYAIYQIILQKDEKLLIKPGSKITIKNSPRG